MTVSTLFVYPLKGAAGLRVDAAEVTPRGFLGDRRWMVAGKDGRFISGRTHPRLILLRVQPLEDGLALLADGLPRLEVPTPGPDAPVVEGDVWGSRLRLREATAARAWLSRFLGDDARLLYQPDSVHRPTDPAFAPGHEVSLADAYPLLVTTEASRRDLSDRVGFDLDVRRFRPNVVVEGERPWAEDQWGLMQIGAVPFRAVKLCARCAVTTLDPDTAARSDEPLRTLATFRKVGSKVLFGQNLVPLAPGVLRVDDELRAEEHADARANRVVRAG